MTPKSNKSSRSRRTGLQLKMGAIWAKYICDMLGDERTPPVTARRAGKPKTRNPTELASNAPEQFPWLLGPALLYLQKWATRWAEDASMADSTDASYGPGTVLGTADAVLPL